MDYMEFYKKDDRFRRYVDACSEQEGKPVEDVLKMRVIQNVGDYYSITPKKEENAAVKNDDVNKINIIECGGC